MHTGITAGHIPAMPPYFLTYIKEYPRLVVFIHIMKATSAGTFPSARQLLIIDSIANAYFWIQVLLYNLHVRHVLIGVFTELLTIPAIIALVVCSVLLIRLLLLRRLRGRQRLVAGLLLASAGTLSLLALLL
jgi:hypothetical protein